MLHAAHGSNTVLRHGELVNAAWQRSVDRARQNYRKACRCPTTLLGGDERFLATPRRSAVCDAILRGPRLE